MGPKYQRPETEVPTAFRYTLGAAEAASIADLGWWEMYRDPILQGLIEEALRSNQDLRVAAARVTEFRAQVGVAAADFYPQSRARRRRRLRPAVAPRTTSRARDPPGPST